MAMAISCRLEVLSVFLIVRELVNDVCFLGNDLGNDFLTVGVGRNGGWNSF